MSRFDVYRIDYRSKYHWPKGDGTSVCGRTTIQDGQPGRNAQNVPPMLFCRAAGCRQQYETLRSWPYWEDECGCVRYIGDIDAPHTAPCDKHKSEGAA